MTDQNVTPATSEQPRCSVIIPTRDKLNFLKPCIDTLLASDGADQLEVIVVDNNSEEAATLDYLATLAEHSNCTVLRWQEAFNFSAINNYAARHCQADTLCLLNNDVEISQPDWLDKMLPLAERSDVGAVGCVLLYPDRSLQHAGIALDELAIARHIAHAEPASYLADQGITAPFAVDAATAACLFVRRDLFLRLGGFNEDSLAVAYNDVDLCLRISDKGLPILLQPAVSLIHHESVTRKQDSLPANRSRALAEHSYMLARWRHRLAGQHFSKGLPTDLLTAASVDEKSLGDLITRATDRLYQDVNSVTELGAAPPALSQNGQGDANYWRHHYLSLEGQVESVREHARQMERAHQLIERSFFWRLTAPLRRLRNLLTGRRTATAQKAEPATVAAESPKIDTSSTRRSTSSSAAPDQDDYKQAYRRDAEQQLAQFLANDERLDFSVGNECRLTVLLVLYNQAPLTLLCLQSLLQHGDVPCKLVIVDNHSTDETEQLLNRIDGAEVIRNEENLGFVQAVNQGAAVASCPYLLLLNNDAMIEPGALGHALATLESDTRIGAVGARISLLDGTLQEAGSIIWNDGACLGYGRGDNPDAPAYCYQRDADYCSGAFLMFRHQQFLDMGCFDEDYAPAYYEESDFCVRLWEAGYRVVYEPRARITHYEFASASGFKGASELQARNRDKLCAKHPEFLAGKLANDSANVLAARNANGKANVLVIDDRVPYPSLGAGYPRCAHLLAALDALELNVTFFPMLFPTDDWQQVYDCLPRGVEVILDVGQVGLAEFLRQRQGLYQTIIVSREHNMAAFNRITAGQPELLAGATLIYDAEAVSAPREVLRRRLLGEQISDAELDAAIRAEVELARDADRIVAVSEREADYFRKFGFQQLTVLGHQLDTQAGDKTFAQRRGLLFVGALRDEGSPNVDSLLWFVINVLPLIEKEVPDVTLTVVGDNSAPSLATLEKDNVQFTGRLKSIAPLYERSRVFIAPTRFAAGIPHKVHEAASRGLPSVTTALLATQLGWQDGEQLLVADTPEQFARQCIRLLVDESLWSQVRDSGLVAVRDDCSAEKFDQALRELFDSKRP